MNSTSGISSLINIFVEGRRNRDKLRACQKIYTALADSIILCNIHVTQAAQVSSHQSLYIYFGVNVKLYQLSEIHFRIYRKKCLSYAF